jgi:hypothetical protein
VPFVGPPRAKCLSEGMRLVALHTEVVRDLTAFWVVVSSAVESLLGRSPGNNAHAEVVGELVTELQKVEGHHSKLEWPATRICDLLLRPSPSRPWLVDHLDEAVGRLGGGRRRRRQS